jgi:general stress protein 26
MTFIADESPTDAARRVIDANSYATLATADAGGMPWATPVWFAERDLREFVWVSRTERRHSDNVKERPEIALVVFDSTTPVGSAIAVYVEAVAAVVPDRELVDALAVFNAKCVASGLPEWEESRVSGEAPHRLYRATSSQVWVLDEHEQRIPLP